MAQADSASLAAAETASADRDAGVDPSETDSRDRRSPPTPPRPSGRSAISVGSSGT